MRSVWEDTEMPSFPRLEGDITTDVLIIGGGAAGLLCAYTLRRQGIECVVAEKGRICSGVTRCTTAKITAQHGFLYRRIARTYGTDTARLCYEANARALEEYGRMAEEIDCDFEYRDNFIYTLSSPQKAEEELRVLRQIGAPASAAKDLPLPLPTAGAVRMSRQAQFHPLKFFSAVAEELPVYENTWVREMIGNTAVADGGSIRARRVIVATHFPFINKHGGYFIKMYQHRSYVLALRGTPDIDGMYVDEDDAGLSFRRWRDLLLLGGGGGRTGKPCGGWEELRRFAARHYPGATETGAFATQDCMTLDGMPYIGRYSRGTEGLYTATGFNKWGMTGSMVAADLLSKAVRGMPDNCAAVFDPSRSPWHLSLFPNGWDTVTRLLCPTGRRCPHLGCALRWNPAEHSWDCSCHGSRFSAQGKLLDNPANGDLPPR